MSGDQPGSVPPQPQPMSSTRLPAVARASAKKSFLRVEGAPPGRAGHRRRHRPAVYIIVGPSQARRSRWTGRSGPHGRRRGGAARIGLRVGTSLGRTGTAHRFGCGRLAGRRGRARARAAGSNTSPAAKYRSNVGLRPPPEPFRSARPRPRMRSPTRGRSDVVGRCCRANSTEPEMRLPTQHHLRRARRAWIREDVAIDQVRIPRPAPRPAGVVPTPSRQISCSPTRPPGFNHDATRSKNSR